MSPPHLQKKITGKDNLRQVPWEIRPAELGEAMAVSFASPTGRRGQNTGTYEVALPAIGLVFSSPRDLGGTGQGSTEDQPEKRPVRVRVLGPFSYTNPVSRPLVP